MRQMASEFHRGIEKMADEADLKDVKQSFNDINNKNFDKTLQNHLDPENEVTQALQHAKDSADLANETKNVEETLKTVANESLENRNTSNNSNEKNKTASNNDEDNLSSAKL